eukprot:51026-Lingulodinium_polyedra.AAC.1
MHNWERPHNQSSTARCVQSNNSNAEVGCGLRTRRRRNQRWGCNWRGAARAGRQATPCTVAQRTPLSGCG